MIVLGICGSLRRDSHNARLLDAAAAELPAGAELRVFDGLRDIPPYDQDEDRDPAPAGVARLRAALAEADALLIATPEYNGSIPGVLKNAIDWASRPPAASPLRFLPTAVIGATTGSFGALWAQAEMRKVMSTCGSRVLPEGVGVPRAHEPESIDDEVRASLRRLLADLVAEARHDAEAA